MKAFTTGLYDYFIDNVVGQTALYNVLAPSGSVFPYVVFDILEGKPNSPCGDEETIETGIVTFNIYSNSTTEEEADDILTSIKAAFDRVDDFTISGYKIISFTREPGGNIIEENEGKNVWHKFVQYSYIIGKI